MTSSNREDNHGSQTGFDTPPGGISIRGLDLKEADLPDTSVTTEIDRLLAITGLTTAETSGAATEPVDYGAETPMNLSSRDLKPTVFTPLNVIATQSRVGVSAGSLALVQGTELAIQADESADSAVAEYAVLPTGSFSVGVGETVRFGSSSLAPIEYARAAAFTKVGATILVRAGSNDKVQFLAVVVTDLKGINVGVSLNGGPTRYIPADVLASMNSVNAIDTEYVGAFFTTDDKVRLRLKKGSVVENLTVNQILPTGIWLVDENGNGYVVLAHQVDTFMSLNLGKVKVTGSESNTLSLAGSATISYTVRNSSKSPERFISGSEAVRTYMASCEEDSQEFQTFLGFLESQVERTTAHSDLVDVIKSAAITYPQINNIKYCSLHIGENRVGEKGFTVMITGGYKVILLNTRRQTTEPINYQEDVFENSTTGRAGIGLAHVSSDNLVCLFSPNIAKYCNNEVILELSKLCDGDEEFMRKMLTVYFDEKLKADGNRDASYSFVLRRP
jgi:hypothetical protein